MTQKLKFVSVREENIAGKRIKYWLPAFFPFPKMFSKGLFLRVVNVTGPEKYRAQTGFEPKVPGIMSLHSATELPNHTRSAPRYISK